MPSPCNAGTPQMREKKMKTSNDLKLVTCFKCVVKTTAVVATEMPLSHLKIRMIME